MIEYRIVEAGFVDELERAVNDAIADGWVPLGGLVQHGKVIAPGESGAQYTTPPQTVLIVAQAMTRERRPTYEPYCGVAIIGGRKPDAD